jgi:hypothetical protein
MLPARVSVGCWFGTERFAPFLEAEILDAAPFDPRCARVNTMGL